MDEIEQRIARPQLSPEELARYSRHLILPEIGVDGQRRLKAARVLCIGAGGLGSPAALYLASAGVGTIGLVDSDDVDLTNLHRQILHGTHISTSNCTIAGSRARTRKIWSRVTTSSSTARIISRRVISRTMFVFGRVNRTFTDPFFVSTDKARCSRPIWRGHVIAVCFPNRRRPVRFQIAPKPVCLVSCPESSE